jgi:hypothetical protein
MTTAATAPASTPLTLAGARRFAEDVLDGLDITERAYHHLHFSLPLVAELVHRAARLMPRGRLLLVGGNALLAECLVRLGYGLEVWQFPGTYLTGALAPLVSRCLRLEDLEDAGLPRGAYRLVIVPLVLESLPGSPEGFLRSLRRAIAPGGRALVATANQSALGVRLAAAVGRPFFPRPEEAAISLSWPALPRRRLYHRDELVDVCRRAGFQTLRCDYIIGERAFLEMEPLNVQDYAFRKLRRLLAWGMPSMRDVIVAELAPRLGEADDAASSGQPVVSVIVSVNQGGRRLRETLGSLLHQSYPPRLYEVIVLHDGSCEEASTTVAEMGAVGRCSVRELLLPRTEGPTARNRAMAEARGQVCAHTDDSCNLPEDWLKSAVAWFDEDTAVVSGPVFALPGSEPRYLSVPGTRPDPDDKGFLSQVLFPITNVFYRTTAALASGGFDSSLAGGQEELSFGWDTELAWRLQRCGWRVRFREEVYQFRLFPPTGGRREWPARQMRQASDLPRLAAAVPEFGSKALTAGLFASKQTLYFDLALTGFLATAVTRRWPWLLLALPWLGVVSQRVDLWPPGEWPGSARTVARIGVRHLVWLAGLLRGSLRARRLVL